MPNSAQVPKMPRVLPVPSSTWGLSTIRRRRKAMRSPKRPASLIPPTAAAKGIRAKVEHPFRVVKQQSGYAKLRYRGLAKNTARLTMLFALSNLWMARRQLLGVQG